MRVFYNVSLDEWPNLPFHYRDIANKYGLFSFEQVLLQPAASSLVYSRSIVDLSTRIGPLTLEAPIISAPMDTVSGVEMCVALHKLGCLGTLPRDTYSLADTAELLEERINFLPAVGLKTDWTFVTELRQMGVPVILLDTANGNQEQVIKAANSLQELGFYVIAGNIATKSAANNYYSNNINMGRVGIGGGAACSTRIQTGIGIPQLFAVMDCADTKLPVIADGGIKNPGHAAFCLAAGAKAVMLGSELAGCMESPGEIFESCGKRYKDFRGQASSSYMKDNNIDENEYRTAEGITTIVPYKGPVEKIINKYKAGLRSAFSYVGAKNLQEFYEKSVFVYAPNHIKESNPID